MFKHSPIAAAVLAVVSCSAHSLLAHAQGSQPQLVEAQNSQQQVAQAVAAQSQSVTVTATRQAVPLGESPWSVGVIGQESISVTKPTHPSELLSQVPGVAVSVTNGEGHQTAIRQGFTTSPVYLFLEDGIPIRATGNFNHNALYEVSIPSAASVEVIRGPASALYGSDAIGGVVNVITRTPSTRAGGNGSLEMGQWGYRRLLAGADSGEGSAGALRLDVNLTSTDGWRQNTGYDRRSFNLRWDSQLSPTTRVKTIIGMTSIDQETGANSTLPMALYLEDPTVNLRSPAYRKVDALRFSSAFEHDLGGGQQLSLTPYLRRNKMDLNGSYNFTGDARIEDTEVFSAGLQATYRRDFHDAYRSRLIVGLDLDRSPSKRLETKITLSSQIDARASTSSDASLRGLYTQYTGYSLGARMYDYEVNYRNLSPYAHWEFSPLPAMRLSAGLRRDQSSYTMDNQANPGYFTVAGREYYLPASAEADFARWVPKLGMVYQLSAQSQWYASYNHGFRTPSESQLFRGGRSASGGSLSARQAEAQALFNAASQLKAIKAEQLEWGLRGSQQQIQYEVVAYQLTKSDDLLSQRDATGYSVQTNNGTTKHRGIEVLVGTRLSPAWRFDAAASYASHRYEKWISGSTDYSGKNIESAPRTLANLRLSGQIVAGLNVQLEWVHVGSYYLDQANQFGKYPGHGLWNLRMSMALGADASLFLRAMNLADKRYADSASQSNAAGGLYAPGLPRTVYAGIQARW
ncbi:MAG: TonB-dependent receptor [Betaproteobacteria bacterium]